MKKIGLFLIAAFALLLLLSQPADAHTNTGHSANCSSLSGSFTNFPGGTNNITIKVDGDESVVKSFSGDSGSVSALWSEFGVDTTEGGTHSYEFSWSADGGGQSDLFSYDADSCVPETTTTTAPPTTTTTPEKPPVTVPPAVVTPPAATPVPGAPIFTG